MFCPKCQQPLDGDEQYICCAAELVQWRCADCAKVSEGFAFPYGRCPQCGGKLTISATAAPQEAALEAVRAAFEIELGGRDFYGLAAAEADDPAVRELFHRLAVMEEEHVATLSRRYHTGPASPSPALRVEAAAVHAGVATRPSDPDGLFRLAIALEQRAVRFFTDRAERLPAGSAERRLYEELAAEERDHVALLGTEYARWRQGKPGLL